MERTTKYKRSEAQYQRYQSRLLPFAYNILGDTLEAQDVVQDVLNFHFLHPSEHIHSPERYLIRSVINRSINAKKRIRIRKEQYNGQWLPVPMYTDDTIYREADKKHILNYSLLVLLERLTAKERAVFILKETFDFAHNEIAEVLGSTEENSRQLYRRARKKLESKEKHIAVDNTVPVNALTQLTDAILQADIEKVKKLLAETIQSFSDGGYSVRAARNVIRGRDNVSKFLLAMYDKYYLEGSEVTIAEMNHRPAILFSVNNMIYRCIVFEIENAVIENVYIVVNPDKLHAIQR